MRRRLLTAALVAAPGLLMPAAAAAAAPQVPLPVADFLGLGKALLGGLEFTADFFRDLFLALFGGLADMLVPDSWAKKGAELLAWIAAVPNYTRSAFGDLRGLSSISLWLGLATLPLTLSVSLLLPSLGLNSASESPGAVLGRTLGAAAGIVLWTTLWSQGAVLCNNVSASYVKSGFAADGMNAYMELIAVGGMVGGVPILGILIVLVASFVFLAGLVLKIFIVLLGAVLFASGPILLGLVPTQRGARLARTWLTAVLITWALPMVWGLILVVSGVLIDDAPAIGAAIGGGGSLASTGGMLVAGCAGIAGPMLCINLARSLLGPLGAQFSGAVSALSPSSLVGRVAGGGASSASGRAGRESGPPRQMTASSVGGLAGAVSERLGSERRRAWQAGRPAGASGAPVVATAFGGTPTRWGRSGDRGSSASGAAIQSGGRASSTSYGRPVAGSSTRERGTPPERQCNSEQPRTSGESPVPHERSTSEARPPGERHASSAAGRSGRDEGRPERLDERRVQGAGTRAAQPQPNPAAATTRPRVRTEPSARAGANPPRRPQRGPSSAPRSADSVANTPPPAPPRGRRPKREP